MGYHDGGCSLFGPPTRAVKGLLIANAAVFVLELLLLAVSKELWPGFMEWFALTPALAIGRLRVWQFVTYAFLHAVSYPPLHLVFNLWMLWMFGVEVESVLGTRRFLWLYFAAVLAGGLCMVPMYNNTALGASAAVFGVMAMFARMFPDRILLVFFVLPMRARTLIFGIVAIEVLFQLAGGTGVAHLAHLGGFAIGWFFLPLDRWVVRSKRRWNDTRLGREERNDAKTREKVDALLAKVGREGLGSLTEKEREFLARASKSFRR